MEGGLLSNISYWNITNVTVLVLLIIVFSNSGDETFKQMYFKKCPCAGSQSIKKK